MQCWFLYANYTASCPRRMEPSTLPLWKTPNFASNTHINDGGTTSCTFYFTTNTLIMPIVTAVSTLSIIYWYTWTYLCCGKINYWSYNHEIHSHSNQLAVTFLKLKMPFFLAPEFQFIKKVKSAKIHSLTSKLPSL